MLGTELRRIADALEYIGQVLTPEPTPDVPEPTPEPVPEPEPEEPGPPLYGRVPGTSFTNQLGAQAHTELGELAAVAAELRTERSAISHQQSGDGRLLLSVPEACERLGVSRPTFERRFLRPGLVRTLWVGRRRMIVAEDLGRAIDRIAGEGR